MTLVSIASGDNEALLRDAGLIPEAPEPEVKVEAKAEPKEGPESETEAPEAEDDFAKRHGLTKEQHEAWTRSVKKAVDKQYRGRKEAEEFAALQYNQAKLAEERAEKLERELRARSQPEPVVKEQEPRRQDFADSEAYFEAKMDWRVKQERQQWEADQAKAREQAEFQRMRDEATARINAAKDVVPDFDDVVSSADMVVPPHIAGYMQESEMIAELGYHFAKDPDALAKLSKMTPARALVEIGKIESKLTPFGSNPEKSPPKAKDTAPEPSQEAVKRAESPITPLNGGSRSQVTKPPEMMSYEDARREFQERNGRDFGKRRRH